MTGEIPAEFGLQPRAGANGCKVIHGVGRATRLEGLDLGNQLNQLPAGSLVALIPRNELRRLGNLTSLTHLDLSANQLSWRRESRAELGELPSLTCGCPLTNNGLLTGRFHRSCGDLTSLTTDLGESVDGRFPAETCRAQLSSNCICSGNELTGAESRQRLGEPVQPDVPRAVRRTS